MFVLLPIVVIVSCTRIQRTYLRRAQFSEVRRLAAAPAISVFVDRFAELMIRGGRDRIRLACVTPAVGVAPQFFTARIGAICADEGSSYWSGPTLDLRKRGERGCTGDAL
jgi:hypothetical protein